MSLSSIRSNDLSERSSSSINEDQKVNYDETKQLQNTYELKRVRPITTTMQGCSSSSIHPLVIAAIMIISSSSSIPHVHANNGRTSSTSLSTICPGGLICHHGVTCTTGNKDHGGGIFASLDDLSMLDNLDLPLLEITNVNGEYCTNCHEGWGGVDCSVRFTQCDTNDIESISCLHGGQCYLTGIDAETGKNQHICDCTSAGKEEGNGLLRYAGKFCQHVQETQCGIGTDEMFCTNKGKCKITLDEDMRNPHSVCVCPEGRAGTHCEFLPNDNHALDCQLDCQNGGTCAKGFKNYDELITAGPFPSQLAYDIISSNGHGEHCVCPDGHTGLHCEIQVKMCTKTTALTKYCYNGATCVYDDYGNPMCDCSVAHTDHKSYLGTNCELEATTRCTPGLEQDAKDAFCSDHGVCINDPETRHQGCVCEDGWTGNLCDIEVVDGVDEPVCDLDCENGGSCRFGVKGYKDAYDNLNLPIHAKKHEDGMHCACPDGFTGLKCEVDINHCHEDLNNNGSFDSESKFCLNGVPCPPPDDESSSTSANGVFKKFGCPCNESTKTLLPLAGRYCEFAVTQFCSKDDARNSHSFCTNGGRCKVKNEHDDSVHHGCCCPDGYEGEYCHLPAGTITKSSRLVTWSPFNECVHEKTSTTSLQNIQILGPNADGSYDHITINPAFRVPPHPEPILEEKTPVDGSNNNASGIVSSLLITLLVIGVAGVVYKKRRSRRTQTFESDWWKSETFESQWWKGDGDIGLDRDENIAPAQLFSPPPNRTNFKTYDGSVSIGPSVSWTGSSSMDELDRQIGGSWGLEYENNDLQDVVFT